MKKVIVAVVLLVLVLLGGLGALIVWLLNEPLPAEPDAIEVIGQSVEEAKPKEKEPRLKVIKPFETEADLMEALDRARKDNSDAIGWLYIPNTDINNSVMQSNNNAYYLRQTEKKQESVYGCYFADYSCNFGDRTELSPNTIIYGHSDLKDDPDGLKFSQLFRFTDEKFAAANPWLCFSTQKDYMQWEIFAVLYTDTDMQYIQSELNPEQLQKLIDEAKAKSIYHYNVPVSSEDHILTLSTCTVKYGTRKDQRFLVMAKLLPPESELPQKAVFTVNPSPKQPKFVK